MSFHSSTAHLFLVLNNIPLSEWTSLFIHSPTEGHLGCLQVLETLNKGLFFLLQKAGCYRHTSVPGAHWCAGAHASVPGAHASKSSQHEWK